MGYRSRIQAVRTWEAPSCDAIMAELMKSADRRLKSWGAWRATENSLELAKLSLTKGPFNDPCDCRDAQAIDAAIHAHIGPVAYLAVLTGVYIRRNTQSEAARMSGVSLRTAERAVQKAKHIVIAYCAT